MCLGGETIPGKWNIRKLNAPRARPPEWAAWQRGRHSLPPNHPQQIPRGLKGGDNQCQRYSQGISNTATRKVISNNVIFPRDIKHTEVDIVSKKGVNRREKNPIIAREY